MYKTHTESITNLSKIMLALICIICLIGFTMQYSADGGSFKPYAYSYVLKAVLSFFIMFLIYKIDLKFVFLLADILYAVSLFLLVLVDVLGSIRLGAQRWLDFGFIVIQPSELMKISIVLILSKYFHKFSSSQIGKLRFYTIPTVIVLVPLFFILVQPDLGTSILIIAISSAIFFLAGFQTKYFIMLFGLCILLLPLAWFLLHDYQQNRVLTFLNPDRDPLGAGYHITQSKIAIGSGGFIGKGYLGGTQGQLDFLPEKHTDFIFTLLSEEFGFVGSCLVILLYGSLIIIGMLMSQKCQHNFGKYTIAGLTTTLFIYVVVNIGMVCGLLPVVGIPLPLISYGGTSMLTTLISIGLILNIENHKNYI